LSIVVVDVPEPDHDRELDFWRAALGQPFTPIQGEPEYHGAQLHNQEAWMLVQRLGDGPARVHLDIHTDDLDAEVARLEALGAQRVEKNKFWWVMRDPAGLPFCVIPDPPGRLSDANAQRWD
jgi:predicted enzyme related to lactoylglutathione lyase